MSGALSARGAGRLRCTHLAPGPHIVSLPGGHSTPGYRKIIEVGYGTIRKQAQDWIDEHRDTAYGDDNARKLLFYTAVTVVCDAGTVLARRYAQACRDKAAQTEDPARRQELLEMADGLDWISEHPARHFRESVQAQMLYIQILRASGISDIGSCGRFDQLHGKFYEKDLADGLITPEQAQEIVDNFFIDVSRCWGATLPEMAKVIGVGNTYMHTTIGGVDPKTGKTPQPGDLYGAGGHGPAGTARSHRHPAPDQGQPGRDL